MNKQEIIKIECSKNMIKSNLESVLEKYYIHSTSIISNTASGYSQNTVLVILVVSKLNKNEKKIKLFFWRACLGDALRMQELKGSGYELAIRFFKYKMYKCQ